MSVLECVCPYSGTLQKWSVFETIKQKVPKPHHSLHSLLNKVCVSPLLNRGDCFACFNQQKFQISMERLCQAPGQRRDEIPVSDKLRSFVFLITIIIVLLPAYLSTLRPRRPTDFRQRLLGPGVQKVQLIHDQRCSTRVGDYSGFL